MQTEDKELRLSSLSVAELKICRWEPACSAHSNPYGSLISNFSETFRFTNSSETESDSVEECLHKFAELNAFSSFCATLPTKSFRNELKYASHYINPKTPFIWYFTNIWNC